MGFSSRFTGLLLAALILHPAVKNIPAVAQPLRVKAPDTSQSLILKPLPDDDRKAPAERMGEHPLRFLPMFGASLLGGAVGGGLGLLAGTIEVDLSALDGDPDSGGEPTSLNLAPIGVWIGSGLGAVVVAQADLGSSPVLLATASATLLGSAIGGIAGAALTGANFWGIATGFVGGAAGGAAYGLWEVALSSNQVHRPALLNLVGDSGRWRVPAIQQHTLPGTPMSGWNVPVLNVHF